MLKTFRGVITASVTPFQQNRDVDGGAMAALMRYYEEHGLCGAFICSSSGEYYAMTDFQRESAVRSAVKAGTNLTVLAQISADRADEAILRAKRMADAGADAVVAQPPRFLDYTPDELYRFFTEIADKAPVPLLLYNHLVRLNNKLMLPLLKRLSVHENIFALKDTHNDAERMRTIAGDLPGMLVYAGGDALAGVAASNGAYLLNALSAIAPEAMCALFAAGQRGDAETVSRIQTMINNLSNIFRMIPTETPSITSFSGSLRAVLHRRGLVGMQCAQYGVDISSEQIDSISSFAEQCCLQWKD